jgi:transposase
MLIPPRAAKDFAGALKHRSKTDALDARVLLEYVKRMEFRPWQPPGPERLALQAIARRISALTKTRAQERNRLHASSRQGHSSAVRRDLETHIRYLDKRIENLKKQAGKLIDKSTELSRALQRLTSVRGIAETSAILILAEISLLPEEMTARQWVAHAGLDPRHVQSGSSVQRPARISRAGNRYLRTALYMPALVAIRFEPYVRAFYQKLVAAGKAPMQANLAVMRKLLHSIHAMLAYDSPFQGEKFYPLATIQGT